MFETITSGLSGWWRSKTGRSPSSPQIYQKTFCMWNTPTEPRLNVGRWPQTSKKASHSPQNEVGQKIKIKRETKNLRGVSAPWGGSCEGGKVSAHSQKCPHQAGMRGARQREASHSLFRGEHSNKCLEGKTERIYHRDRCQSVLPSQELAGTHATVRGAEWWSWGFRIRTPGRWLGLTTMKILWGG